MAQPNGRQDRPTPEQPTAEELATAKWLGPGSDPDAEEGVEVAFMREGTVVAMRAIETPGVITMFTRAQWDHFLMHGKRGDYDV
jgi:hypothetical protein